MSPEYLSPLANHLWQSTLFAGMAALLVRSLRRNSAQVRYWIWLAASLKFLAPFSILVSLGMQFEWRAAAIAVPQLAVAFDQLSEPFALRAFPTADIAEQALPSIPLLLAGVWLCGCAGVLLVWWRRWRQVRGAISAARLLSYRAPLPVLSTPVLLEPGVAGVFRPVLLIPEGIVDRLTQAQFAAITAHELCHVRRRDNLAAAVHMVVEAIFWFHPLVWWIGARMVEERERACDEEVLRLGSKPEVYAEGILNVCRFYLESPLECVSGVTGSDLKQRIGRIMDNHLACGLSVAKKLLLASVGVCAVAGPILIGVFNAPRSQAQSSSGQAATLVFEVASIKRGDPAAMHSSLGPTPGGGLKVTNFPLRQLVAFAYGVFEFQLAEGPDWMSERYDVLAKPERPEGPQDMRTASDAQRTLAIERLRERLPALLAERFQLSTHRAAKELPVYTLKVAKGGHKLRAAGEEGNQHLRNGRGEMIAEGTTIEMLTQGLSVQLGRPVLDRTGLTGKFDFRMEWIPDPAGPVAPSTAETTAVLPDLAGPSLFTAVQEQLGLKLESGRGPVDVIVIDRVEKPSEN